MEDENDLSSPGITVDNPVLGATTALLNSDPFDDLILQASDRIVMVASDGAAGWQLPLQ